MQIRVFYMRILGSALLLSAAHAAHASDLPWLPEGLQDPFAMEKKANNLVDAHLKPATCPATPNLDHKLPFNEIVAIALCHNPDTKAAYFGLVGQAAASGTSYSGYLPSVTTDLSRSRTSQFAPNNKYSFNSTSSDLLVGLVLYDFGQREFRVEVAEQALISAGYNYNSTLQGMIAATLQGYYQLLAAQQSVEVAAASERYAKESYDAAALRHQIGEAPVVDELQAKGAYSQAQLASEQARNNLALDRAALALLMGLNPDTQIDVADMDDSALTKDPFDGKLDALMKQAGEKRNDLLASRTQLKESEASLNALKRADLATVSVTTNLGYTNYRSDVFSQGNTRSEGVVLSVSVPLFTGFYQTYNERAARDQLDAQREQLKRTELNVQQDVWNAWHNYETAKQSWETSFDLMASATKLKDVSLGRYTEGLGTILDVLSSQSQYSSALQSQLQSHYTLLTSRLDLVRAVGVLNLDTMRPETTIAVPPVIETTTGFE